MSEERYKSFAAFFPFYLEEHSDPVNRALHYVGTSLSIGILITGLVTQYYWLLLMVPFAGYGFAWVGHFIIERNRPATFQYPFWSLLGEFKMLALFVSGRLGRHLPGKKTQGA